MTGSELIKQSLKILGYSDNGGNTQLSGRVMSRAVSLINLVYNDLRRICGEERASVSSLSEELELPEKAADALICGVAAYIALSEGDDLMQAVWSQEYQQRRTALSEVDEIEDVLPRAY